MRIVISESNKIIYRTDVNSIKAKEKKCRDNFWPATDGHFIYSMYLKGLNEIKSMYILDLEFELVSFKNCVYLYHLYYPRFFEKKL